MWTNLKNNTLKGMTSLKSFPRQPSVALTTLKFSTPRDIGLKYGQRLYGYFVPPETGNYIFAVSCTNECDLALSKSDKEEKKEVILSRDKTGPEDVSSEPTPLKGGFTYFIEGLSVHGKGDSPMKVGVRLPSSKILAPIPAKHLKTARGGLVDEEFDQIGSATLRSLFNKDSFPDQPSRFYSLDDFNIADIEGVGSHGHRTKGYYLATETGKHQFFASCGSGCRLYIGKDDSCNKRTILFDYKYKSKRFIKRTSIMHPWIDITNGGFKRSKAKEKTVTGSQRWFRPENMFDMSKPVDLEAGLYYYIEALHTSKGNKMDRFRMGVVPPSNKTQYPIRKEHLQQFQPNKHGIVREMWRQIKGDEIHDLQRANGFPQIPSQVEVLNEFEMPSANRYNYGQRLRGYFVAPMSGEYRFVMSCDKKCELWISSSERSEHKRRMLQLNKATPKRTFTKYPEQQVTIPIQLAIGQEYYMEALHKASTGLDHLSVGVTLPNGKNEWPIPKKYIRFRPHKDGFSSHLNIPCKNDYDNTGGKKAISKSTLIGDGADRIDGDIQALMGDLDELKDAPQAKQVRLESQQMSTYGDGFGYGPREFTSQKYNDMENDIENEYEQPQQRQQVEFYISRKDASRKVENAVAKVKITHLELPFGKTDAKTADAALKVLNKLDTGSKKKIKIIRGKSGGFTLSGLPASLSEKEVNQIAKGLASVMENKRKKKESKFNSDASEDSPKKASSKKKSKNKKASHKVSKLKNEEGDEEEGKEEGKDDNESSSQQQSSNKIHYANEEDDLTTTNKTDKAEDKESKFEATEKQEEESSTKEDSKDSSDKQEQKEDKEESSSKEDSKFSSEKSEDNEEKEQSSSKEDSKFSSGKVEKEDDEKSSNKEDSKVSLEKEEEKEHKEGGFSKVSLSKERKNKDQDESPSKEDLKAALNKNRKNEDKEESTSKGDSKVSLNKDRKNEDKETSSKVSFHEETRNKDKEESSSKENSKFNGEKKKEDKEDSKVSLNKGKKNRDEQESTSKVSSHKERKNDDKGESSSKEDSKVSLNKGKKDGDEEESSSNVSFHKERKNEDKEENSSKTDSKFSKERKNEDKGESPSKEDLKVSLNTEGKKEDREQSPSDKDSSSSPSSLSSALKDEKYEKNEKGEKEEDSPGDNNQMLQKAIEKLKANFKLKGPEPSKLPDGELKEEAISLGNNLGATHPGRLDLQEGASTMMDASQQEASLMNMDPNKLTAGGNPSLAASHPGRLDLQEKQSDGQQSDEQQMKAAVTAAEGSLNPPPSMNLPPSFNFDDDEQIKPSVLPNIVPLSHSTNKLHPITKTPWHSWNKVYEQNLVHAQQLGGGSHHGVGLPDTGQGSLLSPLSNKEPFIESVSVLGNAMNIRPNTGGHTSETAPDPNESTATQWSVEQTVGPTTPQQPSQQLQGGVFLGGDSVGAPVSDTLPGSILALGNEQPPEDKVQAVVQPSTTPPLVVGQPSSIDQPPGIGQRPKTLELSRLNEYDILDVDLDGINRLNKDIFRNSIPQNEIRSKISRIKKNKKFKRHRIAIKRKSKI